MSFVQSIEEDPGPLGVGSTTHNNSLASNAMGLWELVLTVLAALAPLTLVVAVAPLHFLKGGAAVPGGYILAAAVMALFAVGFTTMTKYVRNTGAFYAIISRGLGKEVGSGAALVAVVAYNSLQISTYGALGVYAGQTMAHYVGIDAPWWIFAAVAVLAVAYLGFRGISTSAKVLAFVLLAEITMLIVMAIAIFATGGPEGFTTDSFNSTEVLKPENGAMFALIFGAFMGFESTAIYSEEAKGGARTVRKATYISVGFIGVFYAIMTYAIVVGYGQSKIQSAAEADPVNLVVNLFTTYTSPFVVEATNVLLLLSAFAALLALHNASNRYFYSLGRESLLPAAFGRTHPKTHAPWVAGIVQSALSLAVIALFALLGLDPYLGLLLWGSGLGFLGIMFLWALCSLAITVYLRKNAPEAGFWKTTAAPLLSFLALSTVVVLVLTNFDVMTGAGTLTNSILIGLAALSFVAGVIRALYLRARRPSIYAKLAQNRNGDS